MNIYARLAAKVLWIWALQSFKLNYFKQPFAVQRQRSMRAIRSPPYMFCVYFSTNMSSQGQHRLKSIQLHISATRNTSGRSKIYDIHTYSYIHHRRWDSKRSKIIRMEMDNILYTNLRAYLAMGIGYCARFLLVLLSSIYDAVYGV